MPRTHLEFRDGSREVPEHVAAILKGIDTVTLTYEQAITAANNRMVGNYVEGAMNRIRSDHFEALGMKRR